MSRNRLAPELFINKAYSLFLSASPLKLALTIFIVLAGLVTGLQMATATASVTGMDVSTTKPSEAGTFQVEMISQLDPIKINTMHRWILKVSTPNGEPVTNAEIAVNGGMPMHNHGLPTAPRVTQELTTGEYLVEGMKFQMPGHWVVNFAINAGELEDTVTFNLEL